VTHSAAISGQARVIDAHCTCPRALRKMRGCDSREVAQPHVEGMMAALWRHVWQLSGDQDPDYRHCGQKSVWSVGLLCRCNHRQCCLGCKHRSGDGCCGSLSGLTILESGLNNGCDLCCNAKELVAVAMAATEYTLNPCCCCLGQEMQCTKRSLQVAAI